MKQIKLAENDLHKIISESVKKVLNELDSKTYMNAADKAYQKGQAHRSYEFSKYGTKMFNKETNETSDFSFEMYPDGFDIIWENSQLIIVTLSYDKDKDEMSIVHDGVERYILKPGDYQLRLSDRKLIRKILAYFNKFAPDSIYNDKNLWIR